MSSTFTGKDIGAAARRVAKAYVAEAERFNRLDAAGGDGDMGTTLFTVSKAILADMEPFAEDVSKAFMRLAKIISKHSGSSLSAVIMTGLITLSLKTRGQRDTEYADLSALLTEALTSMQQRSKAPLGSKTVLDGLHAVCEAVKGGGDARQVGQAAHEAAIETLAAYREKPAMIGRLRLEPSKGVGLDDPGMVALEVGIAAMIDAEPTQT
ncbi:DAK2 domain-containing protein [Pseudohoeflea coraliihabitans]|uniref:DAK2 domain-containing protein n=1 Tax=Pseudohoeflea coraliihabitans TaxID=2860393 RepID=A0ABS6WKF0_9HYPH|nr:DAK2 domain-containing protein [Pseudohoeflea sp. DP4N28-3]MBW3096260.1 DAK2 domain-containing protein [Pseudohoeflea sp. DP4N28-3]